MVRQVVTNHCGSCDRPLGEDEYVHCLECEILLVERSLRMDPWLKARTDIVIRETWEYLSKLRQRLKEPRDGKDRLDDSGPGCISRL